MSYNVVAVHLWHSQCMLQHSRRNAVSVVVPTGAIWFEENTVWCMGRCAARSYLKVKPVQFQIQLHLLDDCGPWWMYSSTDDSLGNIYGIHPAKAYCRSFWQLRSVFDSVLNTNMVYPTSTSALWAQQIVHAAKTASRSGAESEVTDIFYTEQSLCSQIEGLTDNEISLFCTVCLNDVGGKNGFNTKFRRTWGMLLSIENATLIYLLYKRAAPIRVKADFTEHVVLPNKE